MYVGHVGSDDVPLIVRMAAHPVRWALLRELAISDCRVRELVAAVDEPQNLVSYHLRELKAAGLVTVRRSTFDGRDSYYHLDLARCATGFGEAAETLHPLLARGHRAWPPGRSVLFLCTGNSARSPMAEALLHWRSGGAVATASAGSHPKPAMHPNAARALRAEYGIALNPRTPQPLTAVADQRFDCVVSLCDKVREISWDFGGVKKVHWSLPDPAASGAADDESLAEFRSVAREIDRRIEFLSLS